MGNRLSETTLGGTRNSTYDIANRLAEVDGVSYTWDNNGNLLSDGVNTYTYDSANRMVGFNNATASMSYTYNGLGDRLSQAVDGITTSYTLDLNPSPSLRAGSGLTQVLSDGTNTYLYGNGRIAQVGAAVEYFLGETPRVYRAKGFGCGEEAMQCFRMDAWKKTLGSGMDL